MKERRLPWSDGKIGREFSINGHTQQYAFARVREIQCYNLIDSCYTRWENDLIDLNGHVRLEIAIDVTCHRLLQAVVFGVAKRMLTYSDLV